MTSSLRMGRSILTGHADGHGRLVSESFSFVAMSMPR
jgi:hypothetical protein